MMRQTSRQPFSSPFTLRIHASWICWIVVGTFFGCTPSNKPILPKNVGERGAESTSKETTRNPAAMLSHPEYSNWSRFPVGTKTVRYRKVTNATGQVEVTSTLVLAEKSDAHVLVQTQVNVQRPGEPLEENPIEEVRFPSQFELPQGMTEEYFQQPSLKAKKTGEEELEVAGVKIKADVFEWTESNETGPMQVKLWRSNEVPGRIVRQEMLIEQSQTKTIEEICEVDWKTTEK